MPNNEDWPKYFDITKDSPPRDNLVKALDLFKIEKTTGTAIDIGSGAGNDVRYLLKNNWNVLAFDNETNSVEMIKSEFKSNPNLSILKADFKEINFQPVELINCSYVLPFCSSDYFEKLMNKIVENIKLKGRFSGNFFAPNHTWKDLTLKSKTEVLAYFKNFEIEYILETDIERKSAFGEDVQFHNIDIVAKKRS